MKNELASAPAPPAPVGAPPIPDGNPETIRRLLSEGTALQMPVVDSPFFEPVLAASDQPEHIKEQARRFRRDGFVIIENAFEPALIEAVLERYDWLFHPATQFDAPEPIQRLLKLDPHRRQDAWSVLEPVRRLAADERILRLLKFLYGRDPIPFQTLNFLPGTQQPTHSDAIHFSCIPAGFMCGVWIALEDVTENNGPLHYYAGSHRLPEMRLEQLGVWATDNQTELGPNYTFFEDYVRAVIQARRLEQQRLTVKKGSALVWASNLLHGGCPILRPGSTRRSQVTHYYFNDCLYYTPIYSNALMGEYRLKDIMDIRTAAQVPHSVNGLRPELIPLPNGNHLLERPGSKVRIRSVGDAAGSHSGSVRPGLQSIVIDIMEEQVRSLRALPRLDPLERASVLVQLCDVALRANQVNPPAP